MQFKRRDGLLSSIFNVITCGLYSIYFWYQYGEDVNVICAEDGKMTQNYIVAWILGMITCGIYPLYWLYNLASRLDTAGKKYDVNVESPVLFTIFMNIPFLSFFYACDVMNKFMEKYEEKYPNGNGYGNHGTYGQGGYGGPVPPVRPYGGGNMQSMGSQIGSQFKSAVQDMGNSIKNTAQSAMPTCKNCGAPVPPGKNYCKRCGYPVNGPAPQNPPFGGMGSVPPAAPEPPVNPQTQQVSQSVNPPVQELEVEIEPTVKEIPPVAEPVQEKPVCPNCGGSIKPGDKFCINCGSKIEQ